MILKVLQHYLVHLNIKIVFVKPLVKQWTFQPILIDLILSEATTTCVFILILNFMTTGFTIPLRIKRIFVRTKEKKLVTKHSLIALLTHHLVDLDLVFGIFFAFLTSSGSFITYLSAGRVILLL